LLLGDSVDSVFPDVTPDAEALSYETMDINKMLAELRAERDQLAEAILVLERLAGGRGKRRGRPPKWMAEVKQRGRPLGSKNKQKEE